jgi:hypothetical protein
MDIVGVFAAALAAATLAAPAAFAQSDTATTVAEIDAVGRSPTTVTLKVSGLSVFEVRGKVHRAARQVCRNAVANNDIGPLFYDDCRDATHDAAMSDYRDLTRAARTAAQHAGGDVVIHLAAR